MIAGRTAYSYAKEASPPKAGVLCGVDIRSVLTWNLFLSFYCLLRRLPFILQKPLSLFTGGGVAYKYLSLTHKGEFTIKNKLTKLSSYLHNKTMAVEVTWYDRWEQKMPQSFKLKKFKVRDKI